MHASLCVSTRFVFAICCVGLLFRWREIISRNLSYDLQSVFEPSNKPNVRQSNTHLFVASPFLHPSWSSSKIVWFFFFLPGVSDRRRIYYFISFAFLSGSFSFSFVIPSTTFTFGPFRLPFWRQYPPKIFKRGSEYSVLWFFFPLEKLFMTSL